MQRPAKQPADVKSVGIRDGKGLLAVNLSRQADITSGFAQHSHNDQLRNDSSVRGYNLSE